MVWLLLAMRARFLWNAVWKVGWKYRLLGLLAVFGMSVFFTGVFFVGKGIFGAMAAQPEWGDLVSEIILFFSFSGALLFFFISTAASALNTLFLSRDIELLIALPVRARTVFAAKLTEALLLAFAFVPFIFLPFLLAYGIAYRASFFYYPAVFLILGALLIWGSCFGLVLASLLVRILPARRANEIIGGVVSLAAVAFAFSFQLFDARLDDRPSSEWAKTENWKPLIEKGKVFLEGHLNYLPSGWAKQSLLWVSGQAGSGAGSFLLLIASAAALFAAVVLSAEKIYEKGWLMAAPKRRAAPAAVSAPALSDEKFFSPFWGIVKKDLLLIRRDFNQVIGILLMPVVMVFIPIVASLRAKSAGGLEHMLPFLVVGLAGVMALQNGLRMVPLEGLSMGQILASPLTKKSYVSSKLFLTGLMTTLELWVSALLLALFFPIGLKNLFSALWLAIFIAASAGAVGVWVGTVFARWDWTKPNNMITPGGVFALIGTMIVLGGLWAGLLAAGFFAQKFLPFAVFLVLGSIIYGAVSFFLLWLFGILTVKRLERLEWKFG